MLKKKIAAAALLLTAPGLAGATALPGPATAQSATHTSRFVLKEIASHSTGKFTFAGADRIRSRATHDIVGFDAITGRFFVHQGKAVILAALALKGGVINARVTLHQHDRDFHGRILSGTGVYRGITGTVDGRQLRHGRTLLTLHWTL